MQELNQTEIDSVAGGLDAATGAGFILSAAALAASSPVVIGVAVGGVLGCALISLME